MRLASGDAFAELVAGGFPQQVTGTGEAILRGGEVGVGEVAGDGGDVGHADRSGGQGGR
jgi:hypothetical protein